MGYIGVLLGYWKNGNYHSIIGLYKGNIILRLGLYGKENENPRSRLRGYIGDISEITIIQKPDLTPYWSSTLV